MDFWLYLLENLIQIIIIICILFEDWDSELLEVRVVYREPSKQLYSIFSMFIIIIILNDSYKHMYY